jgi:hypothetical protein
MKSAKQARKPKLTDAERHRRFLEIAAKVGASDSASDFDSAFEKVVGNNRRKFEKKLLNRLT